LNMEGTFLWAEAGLLQGSVDMNTGYHCYKSYCFNLPRF